MAYARGVPGIGGVNCSSTKGKDINIRFKEIKILFNN